MTYAPGSANSAQGKRKGGSKKPPAVLAQNARISVVQSLYSWYHNQVDPEIVLREQLLSNPLFKKAKQAYALKLFRALAGPSFEVYYNKVAPYTHCDGGLPIAAIEKCVLVLGVYELDHELEIPGSVILNEAIEVCKQLGGTGSHALINAALDRYYHDHCTAR